MREKYFNSVNVSKTVGNTRINVKIRVDDHCGNGHCDFAITADIFKKDKYGNWEWHSGGCRHEEILKHFPELSDFVDLHLSNVYGQPMHAVSNGHYLLMKEGAKKCAQYLRIDEDTARKLSGDKDFLKYQLFALGIVDKWKEEADKAIEHFEALKGEKWVNPHTPEEERGVLRLTDEEKVMVEELIESGYYTPEAIRARDEKEKQEKRERDRAEIIERCDKKVSELIRDRDIDLFLLDSFGTDDNVIYYSHSNTICFNWKTFGNKIWTQEEFDCFVNTFDKSIVPDGVKFEFKSI